MGDGGRHTERPRADRLTPAFGDNRLIGTRSLG
jgi:hypothetical protein